MSKPAAPANLNPATDEPCCPPMAHQRIEPATAGMLAPAFKALGDPVRLQLMSMIASAPGGDARTGRSALSFVAVGQGAPNRRE